MAGRAEAAVASIAQQIFRVLQRRLFQVSSRRGFAYAVAHQSVKG